MRIEYKCRMCGKTFSASGGGRKSCVLGLQIAMNMAGRWEGPLGEPPGMTTLHHCADGSFGVADLIGARSEEAGAGSPD